MVCGLPNCLLSAPSSRERHGPFDFTAITICSLLWFMSRFTTGLYIYESLEVDCVVQGCFVDTGGVPCSYRPSQSHTSSVKREEKTQERAKSCGSDPQIGTEGWHNRSGTQCKSSYSVCYFFFLPLIIRTILINSQTTFPSALRSILFTPIGFWTLAMHPKGLLDYSLNK